MGLFSVLVICTGLSFAYGLKCGDISGTWENELGSEMDLKIGDSNRISGTYRTAVESHPGAAAHASNITGLYSIQGDAYLLAFSVLFNRGNSLTTWVGQCMVCDGKEVLHTSYVYRWFTTEFNKKWSAVTVNQNTFFRKDGKTGDGLTTTTYSPVRTRSVVSNEKSGGLDLSGKWKSSDGEEFEIFADNGNLLTGKHLSKDLLGRKDGNSQFTAVSLMSPSGKKIRSWTGYIYDTPSTVPKVLEVPWLEHEFSRNCVIPRNNVRFGVQNFTRAVAETELSLKSETILDKIRRFFSSMF